MHARQCATGRRRSKLGRAWCKSRTRLEEVFVVRRNNKSAARDRETDKSQEYSIVLLYLAVAATIITPGESIGRSAQRRRNMRAAMYLKYRDGIQLPISTVCKFASVSLVQ